MNWLLILAAFFFLILPGLLLLYFQGAFRGWSHYRLLNLPAPDSENFAHVLGALTDSFPTQGRVIRFWVEAEEIFAARMAAIQSAQHSIQFETFIMTPGRRADEFAKAIADRARHGVSVQLIVDSYGTKSLDKEYWHSLRQVGVEVQFFNPFNWRSPLDYLSRTHRKMLLIDGDRGLIGGAGIADRWDGVEGQQGYPWYDFEVEFQGALIGFLEGLFWQHWLDAEGTVDLKGRGFGQPETQDPPLLVVPGEDPSYRDSTIRAFFHTIALSATKRLWIASPYLLPDENSAAALSEAVQRGVDVRILTMGHRNDKSYVYYTSRERYRSLLKAGIQIYEYQPSMMHAKILLIDESWVSLGSANLDPRSFFHNDELNLATPEAALLQWVEEFFITGFSRSQQVEITKWHQRPLQERVIGKVGALFHWQL